MSRASSGAAAAGLAAGSWKARARPERARTKRVAGRSFMIERWWSRNQADLASLRRAWAQCDAETDSQRGERFVARLRAWQGRTDGPRILRPWFPLSRARILERLLGLDEKRSGPDSGRCS